VCIPVFNGKRWLARAINSVLDQPLTECEVVICDDASSDGSYEVAASLVGSRIRLERNSSRLGLYANHNRCLELARSEWVVFLHQDDELLPGALDEYRKAVEGWKGAVGAAFGFQEGHCLEVPEDKGAHFWEAGEAFLALLRSGVGLTPSGTLYSRRAVLDCGGFDERHRVADMVLILAARGYPVGYVPRALVLRPGDNTFPEVCA
jgi:glycosyltransferase involved in cell wall biosynthesis